MDQSSLQSEMKLKLKHNFTTLLTTSCEQEQMVRRDRSQVLSHFMSYSLNVSDSEPFLHQSSCWQPTDEQNSYIRR